MKRFFYPRSIAVFGVSDSPSNLGRIIVQNLDRFGFKGDIYPVGTGEGLVSGKKVLAKIETAKGIPDLAVLLVPAERVPETLDQCGAKGIRHVIIESGGFSELDEGKRSLEAGIRAIAEKWAIKVVGPNCFGVINLEAGVVVPFFILNPAYMGKGSVSLISQSGGIYYDTCMLASFEGVGLNKLISVGNKLATNETDCLEYLIEDEGTKTIGLYLESFSEGKRLMEIAGKTTKPIVCLKANRSRTGHEIALFHTTALAGDDAVADGALRQSGIHRVRNFREMMDAFKIFSLPVLKGRRLALITRSGGHGVLAADAVHRHGFTLAPLSDGFFDLVKSKKINVIRMTNPVDVGDIYDLEFYGEIIEKALQEKEVDGVAFVVTFSSETDGAAVRKVITRAAELAPRYGKPIALCAVTNRDQWSQLREITGFPLFTDVDDALWALARSLEHHENTARRVFEGQETIRERSVQAIRPVGLSGIADPDGSFSLLKQYGVPVADYSVAKTIDEAIMAAQRIGYPVAVKTASPEVLHKTENQGVVLNVSDSEALRKTIQGMDSDAYLVQKMAPVGVEVIVGGKRDQEFGPIVLLGLGGIFTEVFKDTAIRVAPIDETIAAGMVEGIKGSTILKGFRGQKPRDIKSLAEVLVRISALLIDHPEIVNLDINPLIVLEEGKGCLAVDVKIGISV
ncbi:MAG: Succinyl-CoA ligase (ADP-forming) subunit alpha [Syntrophorhabdus sp. PtaU1.Bin002]|nr:MAG: Succinyl-CoA ligase (ADP-forming) subunit alpha [Syntrophorhabdus sp. PtaU1.Bin002]